MRMIRHNPFASAILLVLLFSVTMLLQACQWTGTQSSASPASAASAPVSRTFNDNAALALQTVAAVRQSATALMSTGKISPADDASVQAALTDIVGSIRDAKALYTRDPTQAAAAISDILTRLNGMQQNANLGLKP